MQSICFAISPQISSLIEGSSFAKNRKGRSWQAESLNHMAGISPVITNTEPSSNIFIVVLSVLEIQFSNMVASLLSAPNCFLTN